jgi:hypothetical protein
LYNYELEGDVVLNYCDGQLTQSDANEAYTVYEYENGELVSVSPLTYAGDGVFYHDNYYFESGYDGNWTFELRNADDEIIDTYEDFKFAESGADTRIVTFTFNMANPELLVEEVEAPEWLNKDTLLKLDIMGIDEADGLERVDSEYMLYSVDEGEYKRICIYSRLRR